MAEKQKLIVIIGPTAVGKTKTSIELAKAFQGEVISGDSMQIYKGMDIGTAKITPEEMQGIPHHLIDIKKPTESYSVAEFQKDVREQINMIAKKGSIPIIVGGTGLYIQSVLYDYHFSNQGKDEKVRQDLERRLNDIGPVALHQELEKIDAKTAEQIHPNNMRRLVRALEVYYTTGKSPSEVQETQKPDLLYDVALVGLTMDRELLYKRINLRVDLMLEEGLLEEVTALYENGVRDCQSIQAIGYKELYAFLEGKRSKEEAIDDLKQNSRRYAKRQLTWFRNKMDVTWFDMTEADEKQKLAEIFSFVAGKLQLEANK